MIKRVLITGATGFLGSGLTQRLLASGHTVVAVSRDAQRAQRQLGDAVACFTWQHDIEPFPVQALDAVTTVFHLMGENIGQGRWTDAKKAALRSSRIDSTGSLVAALPPSVTEFLCASAIGIYPGRGATAWDEDSNVPTPASFMAQLCWDWEQAAAAAQTPSRRQVALRTGLVLGSSGMLAPLVPLYKLGLGGPIGDGQQCLPWIHLDDALAAFEHVLNHPELTGPVNVVGPAPVSLNQFSASLAQVLGRPHLLRVPALAMKLALGEAAALILSSYNVQPTRLADSGFRFQYAEHRDALAAVIRDAF